MPLDHTPATPRGRLSACRAGLAHGTGYIARTLCRTTVILGALALALYFAFCIVFLLLRYVVMPNIDHYKGDIERLTSRAVGQVVSIQTISATWQGIRPSVSLRNVVIHDKAGVAALTLPQVNATLSWWSFPVADLRLHRLELIRPDIDIRRDANGVIQVGGIAIDPRQSGHGRGADWVLSQHEILIRNGTVHWIDARRNAPELSLQRVNFLLQNTWLQHHAALTAVPASTIAAPIDLRASFSHPRFGARISDMRLWTGEIYADLHDTDLAQWKAYLDFPFELERGTGSVRAWLQFDRARVADFTADVDLVNVATRLRTDLQPLNLTEARGRLSVREVFGRHTSDGTPTLGALGHTVALSNFSMHSEDGLHLAPTSLRETFTAATARTAEKFEIAASMLDLATLASFVERLPLAAAPRRLLSDFAPRGKLIDFVGHWEGVYPAISAYSARGQFVGLSLNAQPARAGHAKTVNAPAQAAIPAIPGFENLTGAIDASDHGGSVTLASSNLKFRLPGYLSDPLVPFEQLALRANWSFQSTDNLLLQVDQLKFAQDGVQVELHGHHLLPLKVEGSKFGDIDVTAHISSLELNRVERYLPLQTPTHLRNWLGGALRHGQLQDVVVRLKGDLAQFPFHPAKPDEKPRGEFTVNGRIVDGTLNYAPNQTAKDGKSPYWPLAEKINGSIAFDRTRMEIRADHAISAGVALSNVIALVPDLQSADKQLEIDGEASGPLQDMLGYVSSSPVFEWIGHFTEETRTTGPAHLGLRLRMPLDHAVDTKVTGALQFMNDDVVLQSGMPNLMQTSGTLEFNEKGFTLNGVKANFLGAPATLNGGTQRDGSILVKADGGVTVEGLRRTYASTALQRLLQKVSGSTRFASTISVKKRHADILVESTMQGIGLDLPIPIKKLASENMPLRFAVQSQGSEEGQSMHDEIRLSLGNAFTARYLRVKSADKAAVWRVASGGIGVNAPAPEPDSGLNINANLRTLNVDAWRTLVASIVGSDKPKEIPGAAVAAADSGPNLAQYLEPDVMAARATELIVGGKKLDNVVIGVSRQKNIWQANIDAAQASGYVTWAEAPSGRGLGKVTARLSSLTIPPSARAEVSDLLEGKNNVTQIPALDIVAENFQLLGKNFGRVELLANNTAVAGGSEWRINRLSIVNQDVALNATGKFSTVQGNSVSNLVYALDIADAGKLLERFGFANVLRGGRGSMQGDLTWNGLPFSLDIPSLTGHIQLDLAAGQFLKVDPGAAKLLGVLSLQSLPRRLTLDFRDVFSAGFAFDGITANAAIAKGVAKTSNFKMRSVNATVLMDGTVDIAAETQNLHVVVLPEINVGAASVVYALAVNPVIGLGSFLAQLFLREPLMRAFTFEYAITGPWQDPLIHKLARNIGAPPVAPRTPTTEHNSAASAG